MLVSIIMPRTARAGIGKLCYHVINRGNGRAAVFHKEQDSFRFTEMMSRRAVAHVDMFMVSDAQSFSPGALALR